MSRDTKKKKQIPIFIDAKTCPYASLITAKREKKIFLVKKKLQSELHYYASNPKYPSLEKKPFAI